jgi:hypothetical protein
MFGMVGRAYSRAGREARGSGEWLVTSGEKSELPGVVNGGMEFGQSAGVGADVGESEFEFACGGEVLRLAALAQDDYPRRIVRFRALWGGRDGD